MVIVYTRCATQMNFRRKSFKKTEKLPIMYILADNMECEMLCSYVMPYMMFRISPSSLQLVL